MRKKIIAAVCITLCLCLLGGCTLPFDLPFELPFKLPWQHDAASVMTVSGAEIGEDLYAYYCANILHDPDHYALTSPDDDTVRATALRLCKEYVAINSAFVDEGLRLTSAYKKQIAANVSTKWSFYRNFYKELDIRKQTVTKFETCEARRAQMIDHLYGTGGAQAVSDIEWNAYYAVNYVTFQAINGYLTRTGSDGGNERLPQEQIEAVEDRFRAMCDAVRGGKSMEDVCKENAGSDFILSSEVETVTINRAASNYPPEFFTSVQEMDEGTPRVIETHDYIFLVVKQSYKSDESYEAHRQLCLQEMCRDKYTNYLSAIIDGYNVRPDNAALDAVFNRVRAKF